MRKRIAAFSLVVIASLVVAPALSQGSLIAWDTDMINAEVAYNSGYTGEGVYIAVLDTGLVSNWRDYFPKERIATKLGIGFYEAVHMGPDKQLHSTREVTRTSYLGKDEHGTHVVSTIIGYSYFGQEVRGVAPEATIIPVKVLTTYHFPGAEGPFGAVFGTDNMVAEGIKYATELKRKGYSPMIVTMSLGGPTPSPVIETAIDEAIGEGVVVIAAAGNEGTDGMDYPGAYPQVISVGACGWTLEWLGDLDPGVGWCFDDVPEDLGDVDVLGNTFQAYMTDFSSRQLSGQDLDVVAPGSWVVGPYPFGPGMSHLPWWSKGQAWRNTWLWNYYYVGGTSQATPHVAGTVALMLQQDMEDEQQDLNCALIENTLESTALAIPTTSAWVFDPETSALKLYTWDTTATGAGIVQADAALGLP